MADDKQTETTQAKSSAAPKTATRKAPAKRKATAKTKAKATAKTKAAAKTGARKSTASKTTARKASATRKSAPRKSAVRSNVRKAENKAVVYERKTRKATAKVEKSANRFADRAQEAGRNALLASLGFYGHAYDQVQEQLNNLQSRMQERRAKASAVYSELVKRGEKVESDARSVIDDIDLPAIADRDVLEAKLDRARSRFSELKSSVNFRSAA